MSGSEIVDRQCIFAMEITEPAGPACDVSAIKVNFLRAFILPSGLRCCLSSTTPIFHLSRLFLFDVHDLLHLRCTFSLLTPVTPR